jgi:NAD-reducing hydrogenase small subunit
MSKARLATVWLDGCSGCHMAFLDIDDQLLALADSIELVYSPLVDHKEFPPDVDITLVEGAVSSQEDLEKIQRIRQRTRYLVSMGDCAVTANVPSMRNPVGLDAVMRRVYLDMPLTNPQIPGDDVPPLLPRVMPVHTVVDVDVFIPGCPPASQTILYAVSELMAGRVPDMTGKIRFG